MKRALLPFLALGLLTAATPLPPESPSELALRTRFASESSQFVVIDGETVHYKIEGRGPAILLLHGSFASLRQWDLWAKELRKHFKVLRYDQSPLGLSGPHPAADYSLEHRFRVIDALMARAGAERFVIVGTSSAGVPAAAYAAARPERIKGIVLNNIAVGPLQFDMASLPQSFKDALAEDATHPGWHAPEYWRQILLYNVENKAVVTPALVEEWTLLNNRMLRDPANAMVAGRSTPTSRTPEDLRKITAPTLLLWSADDHETRLDREGAKALELVAAKDKALIVVENCGHMMPLDCPARALEKAMPFLKRVARD
ncbi:alpha/beta hydrolase (plasmid) [Novosphingobium sp. THN1]|uniref:alpha/beta fold hydrolase n=1 Tax=Novosphingobium sp. THN1 TaxID=1016987 RepID=UPI000E498540|nr:alpha/beta hydrolase [Novosphingobium sp. THN1]AXU21049.1 alpha/beta hydrolase [Novosphingobium sp. THN1]